MERQREGGRKRETRKIVKTKRETTKSERIHRMMNARRETHTPDADEEDENSFR